MNKENSEFKNKFHKFICDSPLYAVLEISEDLDVKAEEIAYVESEPFKIDMYCAHCEKEATFIRAVTTNRGYNLSQSRQSLILLKDEFSLILRCLRDTNHLYRFSILEVANSIIKIGQYPSMETISNGDIAKYRTILNKQDYTELHRAGGLASHGIGIASYVYLRRIFERLIFKHYEDHKQNKGEIENFTNLRIDEKISALSDELPASLVQHKAVYKILSKGIHELDEVSCKKYYPVVRAVIIAILEEDLQRKEKRKAASDLQSALSGILAELNTADENA